MSEEKKKVRHAFRDTVFDRDGNACRACSSKQELVAHHIADRTRPEGGYIPENGVTLCSDCHEKAEVWHSSGGNLYERGFLPEDLYKLIGVNPKKRQEASIPPTAPSS